MNLRTLLALHKVASENQTDFMSVYDSRPRKQKSLLDTPPQGMSQEHWDAKMRYQDRWEAEQKRKQREAEADAQRKHNMWLNESAGIGSHPSASIFNPSSMPGDTSDKDKYIRMSQMFNANPFIRERYNKLMDMDLPNDTKNKILNEYYKLATAGPGGSPITGKSWMEYRGRIAPILAEAAGYDRTHPDYQKAVDFFDSEAGLNYKWQSNPDTVSKGWNRIRTPKETTQFLNTMPKAPVNPAVSEVENTDTRMQHRNKMRALSELASNGVIDNDNYLV